MPHNIQAHEMQCAGPRSGYSFSTKMCPSDEDLKPWIIMAITLTLVFFVAIWLVLSWRFVFGSLDFFIKRVLASFSGCLGTLVLLYDGHVDSQMASRVYLSSCVSSRAIGFGWLGSLTERLRRQPIAFSFWGSVPLSMATNGGTPPPFSTAA